MNFQLRTFKNINMKLFIKWGVMLLAFVCFATTSADAQQKIGHMNSQAVFAQSPDAKAAQSQLETYSKQLNDKYMAMEKALQDKVQTIQQSINTLTPNQVKEKEQEVQQEAMELEKTRRQYETDILKKEQEIMQPAIDKFAKTIETVAKENGYTLVIDSSALLHAGDSDDITGLVKAKLGI